MDEIEDLVDALNGLGSPFLQARRPGLSPDELRAEVQRHMPGSWADYIDDDVRAWFAWQNGADPVAQAAGGETWRACTLITPDGFTLKGIHEMLPSPAWAVAGSDYPRELGIVFPLGPFDSIAGDLFLHKASPDDEWRVWEHTLSYGLGDLDTIDGFVSPPTFNEWLRALTDAINTGRLVLGRQGNVTVPGEGVKHTKLHSYPWKD